MEGTDRETRTFTISVAGDTADEIDLFALDEARRVFGPDVPLAIDHSYLIVPGSCTTTSAGTRRAHSGHDRWPAYRTGSCGTGPAPG